MILGITASHGLGARSGGDYESIATVTVGVGGSNSIEFTSIPSTYKHLQIRILGRDSRTANATNFNARFNSDTGSNYASHILYGNGTAATSGVEGTSATSSAIARMVGASAGSNVFGAGVIDILDYANTNKYKTIRSLSGSDNNGSGDIYVFSGLWMSTNAITSISIFPVTTPIVQYSHFALYGIRG